MASSQNADLDDLLVEPREGLDIEVKEWLDLEDNAHRASLAKEVIALANHGGGYLVIGFEQLPDGSFRAGASRPVDLVAWSQDAVQGIIAKYIDPGIQCRVVHHAIPGGEDRFPIIAVPGGQRVPVRAKRGSPDGSKLVAHRIYIRRAGPSSEEPQTAEEWDRLIERCVQNRQGELLEAMRSIMAGIIPTGPSKEPGRIEQLEEFQRAAVDRWGQRTAAVPADATPRFPDGYYDFGVAIDGAFDRLTLSDLRGTISGAVRNHSGWPPFLTIGRAPFDPKPVDGAVEFWRGPDTDGSYAIPARHDFWRISPDGLLFTRRGLPEDAGFNNVQPGTTFDITTAIWRVGEAILEAAYIAQALNAADANLICQCSWKGLQGRELVSFGNPLAGVIPGRKSEQNDYRTETTVSVSALPSALPEVVHTILAPLYELFDFFKLPKRTVENELTTLQKGLF